MILVDFSPIQISCAFGAHKVISKAKKKDTGYSNYIPESGFKTFEELHMFRILDSIRKVRKAYRAEFGNMLIAVDNKPYWRNEIFPLYKANRKKPDPDIDWKTVFANGDKFLDVAESVFGYKVISIDRVEADDIIGVLVADQRHDPHMIISPDGDFKQLQRYPNVYQYDTIHVRRVSCKNPEQFLQEKIIKGDSKDGIPNIKSPEDIFMTPGVNQTGIKNEERLSWRDLADPKMFCSTDKMLKRHKMNEKLIDLTLVPDDIQTEIKEAFRADMPIRKNGPFNWFVKQGFTRFIDQSADFG